MICLGTSLLVKSDIRPAPIFALLGQVLEGCMVLRTGVGRSCGSKRSGAIRRTRLDCQVRTDQDQALVSLSMFRGGR